MLELIEPPPMFDEIDAAFGIRGKGVIFAWGHSIFNPDGVDIPDYLIEHERVHGARQLAMANENWGDARFENAIRLWWSMYIIDPKFRLDEEIHAHRAEYEARIRFQNRRGRRQALKAVSQRLASPLYGRLVTPAAASKLIKREKKDERRKQDRK